MELRLLMALILMGAVLFSTPYFYKMIGHEPSPPVAETVKKADAPKPNAGSGKDATKPPDAAAPKAAEPPVTKAAAKQPAAATPEGAAPVAASTEETLTVQTDTYRIEFSNRGGVVKSWQLLKYQYTHQPKNLELVNPVAGPVVGWPFSLRFPDQKPSTDLNQALFVARKSADGLTVEFDYSNGKLKARKVFSFERNSYKSRVETEVTEGGARLPHLLAWRGGFGDLSVSNASAMGHSVHFDVNEGKLRLQAAGDAKNGPLSASGNYSFAGVEDLYFAAVFLPQSNASLRIITYADSVATPFVSEKESMVGASVGDGHNRMTLFVGPKDLEILQSVNPKLAQIVDFGWLGFIAKPLFLIVQWIDQSYIHNYGWSIILVTIVINFALFPLKLSSMKSMRVTQALQPQVQAINDKYKNIGMRDPRKQQQQAEVMALYQKHGVNPLGGCVPLLLQMPFLFAFYTVFTIAIEMRGASWLWVSDLSQHETLPIRILPITMIITQVLMQKMTPTTGSTDPTQQKMMMFMPLIFGVMFYSASSGLMLYWLTGNLVAIAQQWFFNRTSMAAAAADSVQAPPKKKGSRK